MPRKFLIIANPGSGAFGPGNLMDAIAGFFSRQGVGHKIIYTSKTEVYGLKPHRETLNDFTDILVIGGDGTIGATVDAFRERTLPISVVPTGTGNDFVKNLGIPRNLDDALNIALNGEITMSDCGVCNGRHFINGVGIGFDGKVVEYMAQNKSAWKGHLAYLSSVVKILAIYRESLLTYSYDHIISSEKIFLMTIANGTTFGGGFNIAPDAKIDDGLLDVCLIKAINPLRRFFKIPLMKKGRHGKLKEVNFFRVKEIAIGASDLLVAHLDGDFIGKPPFTISVKPANIPFRTLVRK
jgi:diacylglycerol kinase (ATP)